MFLLTSVVSILIQFYSTFVSSHADSPESNQQLYIELTGTKVEDYKFQFGTVNFDEKVSPTKMEFRTKNMDEGFDSLLTTLAQKLTTLPAEKQNVLIYIHGMWAHQQHYWKEHTQKMEREIFSKEQNPYGIVVSLIWECGLNYKSNVPLAYDKGKKFSPVILKIIESINQVEGSKISLLCHSMGNRVMQGFYDEINTSFDVPPFHNILMAGADLESDIFEADQPLNGINNFAKNVIIYVHNNDRSLKMSKLLNESDRLGLQGVSDFSKVPSNISTVDVSVVTDNESFSSRMSNHRYFCESPTVRNDILNCLCKNENSLFETRKQLKNPRSYMLLFGGETLD